MVVYLTGFTVALGLIVAIGAQNAWVLSMSVRRLHPWPIAAVCFSIDSVLMATGTLFMHQIRLWLPSMIPLFTLMGIGILLWMAANSVFRAIRGNSKIRTEPNGKTYSLAKAIVAAMAISLMNPHVYLDTVFLVGSVANTSLQPWLFWLGASSASVAWFSTLAAIGKPLGKWLGSTTRWRIFDGFMAVLLCCVAYSLVSYL